MTTRATLHGQRAAATGVLLVGGGAVAVATWVSGSHGWAVAVMAVYVILAAIALVWTGRSGDVAAILRVGGDERQRGLDRDAVAITGLALTGVALVGGIIEIGRTGNPGVYGLFCFVAGIVYVVSLFELRRRR